MKQIISIASLAGLMAQAVFGAEPALTIYNQDFAVVRDTVPLDLKSGVNNVRYADATARVEPDSVILRDPGGKHSLQIWEQNYRNDPVTQKLLLSVLSGHRRYAHITALRCDPVNPPLLGMRKVVSEDSVRRGLKKIDEAKGLTWLQNHLDYCTTPLLG